MDCHSRASEGVDRAHSTEGRVAALSRYEFRIGKLTPNRPDCPVAIGSDLLDAKPQDIDAGPARKELSHSARGALIRGADRAFKRDAQPESALEFRASKLAQFGRAETAIADACQHGGEQCRELRMVYRRQPDKASQ